MKTQLAILVGNNYTQWKEKLPAIRFAMNTAHCETTGFSPSYLTFGRELRTPDDVQRDMRAIIETEDFVPQIAPYLLSLTSGGRVHGYFTRILYLSTKSTLF